MVFKNSKKIGSKGEIKVILYLYNKGIEVKDYTDYSLFKYKQRKGYDIEVKNNETNEWDRVDIKTNSKKGFIYLEVVNDTKTKLGWFWTSSADLIYHYDLKEEKTFGYELSIMRNFIYQNEIRPNYGRYKNLIGLKVDELKIVKEI